MADAGSSLWTRVGLALTAPAQAFARADRAGGRAGLTDAVALLFLKILCLETRALVAAGWSMVQVGVMPSLSGLGPRLQAAIGTDLVLVFVSGMLVTAAAGRRRRPGRDFDLAAVAWIPYLVITLIATLVVTVLELRLRRGVSDVLGLSAIAVMAAWLGLAIRHARSRRGAEPKAEGGSGPEVAT